MCSLEFKCTGLALRNWLLQKKDIGVAEPHVKVFLEE
jgi:hypothetical protein